MDDAVNNLFGIREENADKDHKVIYNKEKANSNINNIIDFVIRGLCKLNKPFKYSVTGVIMQNNGASLNTCCIYKIIQACPIMIQITMEWSHYKEKSGRTSLYSRSSQCKYDVTL